MPLRVRLVLGAAVLVGSLLALTLLTGAFRGGDQAADESSIEPASPGDPQAVAPANAAVARGPSALDALGAPEDPLPAPLTAAGGPLQSGEAADTLAAQVLAGTSDSLAALVAALQASGIGILGPGNSVDAKPAEPWQGMTMQRWEVRTSAAMVLPERTVTFTLSNLAAFLVDVIPELKGAPVEQLIVQDLRALAESPVATTRFFTRFVAALGRNASSHPSYDLLADVDPLAIQLDGLQASLILRRLSTDVLMLAGDTNPKKTRASAASVLDTLYESLSPTVHAQSQPPCRMSDSTQTIMDAAAFGTSMAWGGFEVGELATPGIMQRVGVDKLGGAAAIASTLLAYAQFIAAYAALEAEVTMDAQPLVRTKKMSPQTGERRQLTGIVKLNIGNAQMLNCFRALLIAVGLDFSLPNDGPVKGAQVSWYGVDGFDLSAAPLHGGSEAIVQFASTDASHPVKDAVTGDDGKVQVGVEGRGQRKNVSNDATAVNKSAKVRLQVALKGADLFGDLQEAAGTAAGGLIGLATLPLSILQRAQWASVGHHTFPVRDWRDGPAEWVGTIKYTKTTEFNESHAGEAAHNEQSHSEKLTLNVNITDRLEGSDAFGGSGAALKGTAQANFTSRVTRSGGRLTRCSGVVTDMKSLQVQTGEGSGSGTARASVGIAADGQYSISISPEVTLTYRTDATSQTMGYGKMCQIENRTIPSPTSVASAPLSTSLIQGDGRIDPSMPDKLSGSSTEREGRTTHTITWDLQRK